MKLKNKMYAFIKKDNTGASLLIMLVLFLVLTVVATNMIMLVSAGDKMSREEYEKEQRDIAIYSIYDVLNQKMEEGFFLDAFVQGETVSIDVAGFASSDDVAIPVTIDVTLQKKLANVNYHITFGEVNYCIPAKYNYNKGKKIENGVTVDAIEISLKSCEEIIYE